MSKTADLRKLITAQLNTLDGETYYRIASDSASYPYKTFVLSRVSLEDLSRDDFELCIDLWDKGPNMKAIEEIADQIETLFSAANMPNETILPTFFRENRYPVDEQDKDLQHIQMNVLIQMYENK